ncbi:hypothetical protein Trydic_g33 [Trypoxylus dichotomus]
MRFKPTAFLSIQNSLQLFIYALHVHTRRFTITGLYGRANWLTERDAQDAHYLIAKSKKDDPNEASNTRTALYDASARWRQTPDAARAEFQAGGRPTRAHAVCEPNAVRPCDDYDGGTTECEWRAESERNFF